MPAKRINMPAVSPALQRRLNQAKAEGAGKGEWICGGEIAHAGKPYKVATPNCVWLSGATPSERAELVERLAAMGMGADKTATDRHIKIKLLESIEKQPPKDMARHLQTVVDHKFVNDEIVNEKATDILVKFDDVTLKEMLRSKPQMMTALTVLKYKKNHLSVSEKYIDNDEIIEFIKEWVDELMRPELYDHDDSAVKLRALDLLEDLYHGAGDKEEFKKRMKRLSMNIMRGSSEDVQIKTLEILKKCMLDNKWLMFISNLKTYAKNHHVAAKVDEVLLDMDLRDRRVKTPLPKGWEWVIADKRDGDRAVVVQNTHTQWTPLVWKSPYNLDPLKPPEDFVPRMKPPLGLDDEKVLHLDENGWKYAYDWRTEKNVYWKKISKGGEEILRIETDEPKLPPYVGDDERKLLFNINHIVVGKYVIPLLRLSHEKGEWKYMAKYQNDYDLKHIFNNYDYPTDTVTAGKKTAYVIKKARNKWNNTPKASDRDTTYRPERVQCANAYAILGAAETDDYKNIRRNFLNLSLKWHPDKNTDEPDELVEQVFHALENAKDAIDAYRQFKLAQSPAPAPTP